MLSAAPCYDKCYTGCNLYSTWNLLDTFCLVLCPQDLKNEEILIKEKTFLAAFEHIKSKQKKSFTLHYLELDDLIFTNQRHSQHAHKTVV